jgi:MinD-like ATPase involved in chromosome partitioning or flagellar assembly
MGICAIWGAPRSGKTTLAVNLAYAMSRSDKTVCLISPVPYSELSGFLGVKIPAEQSLQAALRCKESIKHVVFKADELFFVLAAPVTVDAFDDNYSSEQVKSLLEQALITFDTVIVDCSSESDNLIAAWSLNRADTVVLNVGGHISCLMWYMANQRALQTVQHKAVYVSSEVMSGFDHNALHQLLKCKPDIKIPYVVEAPLMQIENKLLYQLPGKKGKAYSGAVNELYEVIRV